MYSYACQKRAKCPLQFYITSYGGRLAEHLGRVCGTDRWRVHFDPRHYSVVFGHPQRTTTPASSSISSPALAESSILPLQSKLPTSAMGDAPLPTSTGSTHLKAAPPSPPFPSPPLPSPSPSLSAPPPPPQPSSLSPPLPMPLVADISSAATSQQTLPLKPSPTADTARRELVYLTSDSPSTLDALEPGKVYVIGPRSSCCAYDSVPRPRAGGMVDHNRHKGRTLRDATALGVATASLPLHRFVELNTRDVLAVNHGLSTVLGSYQPTRCFGPTILCRSLRDLAVLRGHPRLGDSHRAGNAKPERRHSQGICTSWR